MVGLSASAGTVSADRPVAAPHSTVDTTQRLDQHRASRADERTDLLAEAERSAASSAAADAWSAWWQQEKAARAEAEREAAARAEAKARAAEEAAAAEAAAAEEAAAAAEQAAATPDSNRELGRRMLYDRGYGEADFDCLDRIWTQESQWTTTAQNPSSGAYGIPQSLPADKMATAGDDWRTNPATQITWGLDYIEARYGSPCSAWDFKAVHGWY